MGSADSQNGTRRLRRPHQYPAEPFLELCGQVPALCNTLAIRHRSCPYRNNPEGLQIKNTLPDILVQDNYLKGGLIRQWLKPVHSAFKMWRHSSEISTRRSGHFLLATTHLVPSNRTNIANEAYINYLGSNAIRVFDPPVGIRNG